MPDPHATPRGRGRVRALLGRGVIAQTVVAVIVLTTLVAEAVTVVADGRWPGGYPGLALAIAGVALVPRLPAGALALVAAAPLVAALPGADPTALWSVAVFVAFLLAARGFPALLAGPVVGAADAVAVLVFSGVDATSLPIASVAGFAALAAAAIGSALRNRRRYLGELEQRMRSAEEGRDAAVRIGVAEERVRIARDLHDTIGHEIAVLGMHLGAAEVQLVTAPEAAARELTAARTGIKAVLAETQQILRVLRADEAGTAPTPNHLRIPDLVEALRAGGADIEVRAETLPAALPQQVSLAAYRITQEALTNAQRYGVGAAALRIDTDGELLRIEVVNAITEPAEPMAGGNGLVGMRERAVSAGGRLEAGADGPLFWLRAELPLVGSAS